MILDGGTLSDRHLIRYDFICWHLQAFARGEDVDKLISLALPPAARADCKDKDNDKDKDKDLQQTAMERSRRREVMTARMMAMMTVLRPPLLRLISSVRTSQRGLTYTWW